jgi:hypothetical protein
LALITRLVGYAAPARGTGALLALRHACAAAKCEGGHPTTSVVYRIGAYAVPLSAISGIAPAANIEALAGRWRSGRITVMHKSPFCHHWRVSSRLLGIGGLL